MINDLLFNFIDFMSMNVEAIIALALILAAIFIYYEFKFR